VYLAEYAIIHDRDVGVLELDVVDRLIHRGSTTPPIGIELDNQEIQPGELTLDGRMAVILRRRDLVAPEVWDRGSME
jgi:hypothetical protein